MIRTRRLPNDVLAGLILALALVPLRAGAQELPSLELDLARPLPAPQETLLMLDRGGAVLPLLAPRFSLTFLGGHAPLTYTGDRDHTVEVTDTVTALVGAALGFGVADVGIAFPVHLAIAGQTDGVPWAETVAGDLVLVPRVAAIPLEGSPVQVVLSVPVTFPTGKEDRFAGRAGLTAEPRARVGLHLQRLHVAVRPGLLIQGGSSLEPAYLTNWGTLRVAVGVGLGPDQIVRPELGLDGLIPLGDPDLASAEILVGAVIHPLGGLRIAVHGGFGAGGMPGVAAGRVVGAISWELPADHTP